MLNLLTVPSCNVDTQSTIFAVTQICFSGAFVVSGLILLSSSIFHRQLIGQLAIFSGLLIGSIPVMSFLMEVIVDCSNKEAVARLNDVLPFANILAAMILMTAAAGVLWSAYCVIKLQTASKN